MRMIFILYRQLLNNELRRRLQEEQQKQQDGPENDRAQIQELENTHQMERKS